MAHTYSIRSKVWLYPGMAGWHFISVDKKHAEEIKKKYGAGARGFGSHKIKATIGKTSWNSSIFPDKKSGTYLLPLKADVRKAEGIKANSMVKFSIEILAGASPKKTATGMKTCSRGHKYRAAPCPVCYPGYWKRHGGSVKQ